MTDTTQKKPRLRKTNAPAEYRPGWWGELDAAAQKVLSPRGVGLYQNYKAWIWGPIDKPRRFEKPAAMGMLNLFIVERFIAEMDERAAAQDQFAKEVLSENDLWAYEFLKEGARYRSVWSMDALDRFITNSVGFAAMDEMAGIDRCRMRFADVRNFAGAPEIPEGALS